jgi:hypothetical protein
MTLAKGMAIAIACFAFLTSAAVSQTLQCTGTKVAVTAQSKDHAALACDAAITAKALFAECAVPALSDPAHIKVLEVMPAGCFGLFHCETRLIEALSPDALHYQRPLGSIFSHVPTNAYFQSIIVHELTHAATDGMPCPFDSCLVGREYISYLMQMKSLDRATREKIELSIDMDAPVSFDGFHPFILMMAPDVFSQRVWAHHHQQDDPCGFVDALVRGEIFRDFEIFDLE